MNVPCLPDKCILVIPAFNEEEGISAVLDESRSVFPDLPVLVVNDASHDETAARARRHHGVRVLDLPCNLGVGGAMQAGFRYALENGYQTVVRCDADGQHPPSEIPLLAKAMAESRADMVLGSRFAGEHSYTGSKVRHVGIRGLALFLSLICRRRVTDPTSGFQMVNRLLMELFAHDYPADYPEPESLALLSRQGYTFTETPVKFRERLTGRSTIHSSDVMTYVVKVGLALFVDRARPVNRRYARHRLVGAPD